MNLKASELLPFIRLLRKCLCHLAYWKNSYHITMHMIIIFLAAGLALAAFWYICVSP